MMRKVMKLGKLCFYLSVTAVMAGHAHAQEIGAARPSAGQSAELMCRAYDHIDGQLAYIKAELKLTPAQEAQWNVFASVFRDDKERQAQSCRRAQEQNRQMLAASLPDSLRLKAQRLSEQLDSLRRLEAAVQPFYDGLSKDQKKIADEIMKGAP